MAKSRRSSRRSRRSYSRKNRSSSVGLFERILGGPLAVTARTVGTGVETVASTAGNIVKKGLGGVAKVSTNVTKGANNIVRGVIKGKSRKASRKNRKSRKSRK